MKKQLGFYIDQSRCSGCNACAMACKDKNTLDDQRLFRRVTEHRGGGFVPSGKGYTHDVWVFWTSLSCNHCSDPVCVTRCPTGAMHKRDKDGLVVIDQDKCVGCRACARHCPYNAPQFDALAKKMSKCDMCLDLLEKGDTPACVAACPLMLIQAGPLHELQTRYGTVATTAGLPAEDATHPNLVIRPHKDAMGKGV